MLELLFALKHLVWDRYQEARYEEQAARHAEAWRQEEARRAAETDLQRRERLRREAEVATTDRFHAGLALTGIVTAVLVVAGARFAWLRGWL